MVKIPVGSSKPTSKIATKRPAATQGVPVEALSNAAGSVRLDDDGGLVVGEPRKSPSGMTNAQELIERAFGQSKSSRSTPTRRIGNSGSWVSGAPVEVPNERIRAILEMMSAGPDYQQLARRAYAELDGKQQMNLLKIIADELPNARAENGWSPQAKAVVDFLQGKSSPVEVKRLGPPRYSDPAEPNKALRENIEFVDSRADAVSGLRPLEDFGLKTERGSAGRDATQDFAFDDSPVLDTAPSPGAEQAPGDIAFVTEGMRAPSAKKPKTLIDKAESRPGLRGMDFEHMIATDNDGNPYPVRVPAREGEKPHFGDVDYGNVRRAGEWEDALNENAERVRIAVAQKYGSEKEFARMVQDAVRSGDSDTVNQLVGEYNQIRESVERQRVPPKPYPVKDPKARASLTPQKERLTSLVDSLARGNIGAADDIWDIIRSDRKGVHSPTSPESGIESAEQLADVLLSSPYFDADRLPNREAFPRFRQAIVDKLQERYWSPTAKQFVDPDPNATVIDSTGNPAALKDLQNDSLGVRTGRDPGPRREMDPGVRDVFDEATASVDRPKKLPAAPGSDKTVTSYRGKEAPGLEGFGTSRFAGVPGPGSPAELAEQSKQALRNWALDRTASGKVVYRDPESGQLIAQFITNQMKPATVARIRAQAAQVFSSTPEGAARFNELWPEGGPPSPAYFSDIVSRANGRNAEYDPAAPESGFARAPGQSEMPNTPALPNEQRFMTAIRSMDSDSLRKLRSELEADEASLPEDGTPAERKLLLEVRRKKALVSQVSGEKGEAGKGTQSWQEKNLRIPAGQAPTQWGSGLSPADADAADLERARREWAQMTGQVVEKPPGFIKRPDGTIARTMFLTPEEMVAGDMDWEKAGGVRWSSADVPYPGSSAGDIRERVGKMEAQRNAAQASAEANDPGPGFGYEGPEVGDPDAPVVGRAVIEGREDADDLQRIIDIIDDDGSSAEDLAWAREHRDAARQAHDAEMDEQIRDDFRRSVLDPINEAAARRQARQAAPQPVPQSATPDVDSNLDAASTPIEPESLPGTNTPAPVEKTPDVQANENADVQKAASDIEGEKADVEAKADAESSADEAEAAVEPAAVPQKRGIVGRAIDTVRGTPGHLWRNKWRYGLAGGALAAFQQIANQPPYAPGQEPLKVGDPGAVDAIQPAVSPEDRIRQVIRSRMQQELIPHTQSRYY